MKHIIISSIAFTLSISFAFAQEIFSVIDIKTFKENYDIVSARDDYGRTIQFQEVKGNAFDTKTNKPIKPLTLGSNVTADFTSATVSPANYNFIKYKIVNAPYRVPCCTIKSSQLLMASLNSFYARIYYSRTGTTEVSYFIISQFTSNFQHLTIGQAIYEEHYNHKKYAILKPWSKEEIINNIFYSYEFNANNNPQNPTDTSHGTTSNSNDSTIYNQIFNQPWEITGGSSLPGGSGNNAPGYLSVNGPADAECAINIYNNSYPPSLVSSSNDKRLFMLSTGTWDIEISGMMIKSVPIKGTFNTRIKAGTLNILSSTPWTLYDSNKVKTIYSSQVSKKVEFPRGIYQLEMNGTTQQIEIKDGQILQYGDSTSAPQTQKLNKGYQPWEIKLDPTIKGMGGEITLEIPKGLRYNTNLEFFNAGEKTNRQASWFGNNKAKLLPGMYDVVIDSRDTIKNVPVELAKQTRLKMGVFMVSGYSNAKLENTSTHQKFTYGAPFKVLLPEGSYYLNGNKKTPIVIKDGELTEL